MRIKLNLRSALAALVGVVAPLILKGATVEPADRFSVEASWQSLVMERDFGDDVQGASGAASLMLDFSWQSLQRIVLNGQFVHAARFFEEGRSEAAYWLSNDDSSVLNELALTVDLGTEANRTSRLRLGRLRETYDFFPSYKNARHKVQAFEGLVWQTEFGEELTIDLGHLERFSSWSSRKGGPSRVNSDFITLTERLGESGSDTGVQFLSADLKNGRSIFTVYDYYSHDFYNNLGLKMSRSLGDPDHASTWKINLRYDWQRGLSGGLRPEHDASAVELTLGYQHGGFSWNAGWTRVGSRNSFLAPFRTNYEIDMSLLWYTNQFEADTNSFHWKGIWKRNSWILYGLLISAEHSDRRENEANMVVRHTFGNGMWVALFGGYGSREFDRAARDDQWARDLRLYFGQTF
ncbi:MAG: hypothetical protein SynsKO_14480 [Synoicihabitans sp.]